MNFVKLCTVLCESAISLSNLPQHSPSAISLSNLPQRSPTASLSRCLKIPRPRLRRHRHVPAEEGGEVLVGGEHRPHLCKLAFVVEPLERDVRAGEEVGRPVELEGFVGDGVWRRAGMSCAPISLTPFMPIGKSTLSVARVRAMYSSVVRARRVVIVVPVEGFARYLSC